MTPDDIRLVRHHFATLSGQEEAFSAAFYDHLFALAPDLRAYFPRDMADQGRKLMAVLHFAMAHLDRAETLAPAVIALGARHAEYGVRPDQFAPVGAALLQVLDQWLGAAFDARARQVWISLYGALADLMRQGLLSAAPRAARLAKAAP